MRSGLVQLEIGVQSANPVTLRAIDRFADMERLKETVECLHRGNNVHIHLDLIAGLPYEDYKSFGQSFDVVYGMKPEQLQLGFESAERLAYVWEGGRIRDKVYVHASL